MDGHDLVIPTPEVYVNNDFDECYEALYKGSFKLPRAYIHVQPFNADQDMPDYDMDEEDATFFEKVLRQEKKFEVNEITFEDMLDRLEKNCGNNAVTLKEAKLLLKEDDDLILAVYDYWVEKRLRLKQPLIPTVKSDKRDGGSGSGTSGHHQGSSSASATNSNNPYIAFRRRTEKMQTRKNRKNDETSYKMMLKLRRDLNRAVTLLEMVKRREKTKKEFLHLTADVFERRYQGNDFDGKIINEILAKRAALNAAQYPMVMNQQMPKGYLQYAEKRLNAQHQQHESVNNRRKPKKRRNKSARGGGRPNGPNSLENLLASSDDERLTTGVQSASSDVDDDIEADGPFAFKRKRNVQYLAPLFDEDGGEIVRGHPWEGPELGGGAEAKYRYSLASLSTPRPRCIGPIRRRVGRGGRIVLDRAHGDCDSFWRSLDFTVINGKGEKKLEEFEDYPHYRPVTPPHCREDSELRLSETPVGLPTQPLKPSLPQTPTASSSRSRNPSTAVATAMNGSSPSPLVQQLRSVNVDSLFAHNAATAVVTPDTLDLFSGLTPTPIAQHSGGGSQH